MFKKRLKIFQLFRKILFNFFFSRTLNNIRWQSLQNVALPEQRSNDFAEATH